MNSYDKSSRVLVGEPLIRLPYYQEWIEELRHHLKKTTSHKGRLFRLLKSSDETCGSPRKHFEKMIAHLREDLQKPSKEALKVVRWMYLSSSFLLQTERVLDKLLPPSLPPSCLKDIATIWTKTNGKALPGSYKPKDKDTLEMGNLPYPLWSEGGITFIRTAHVVTPEGKFIPEYCSLLRSLEEEGENCLYINNMSLDPSREKEQKLSTAMHREEKLFPNLFVHSLERDIEYPFPKVRWSDKRDHDSLKNRMDEIHDFVLNYYFEGVTSIGPAEKKQIQLLCFVFFVQEELEAVEPAVCHLSCLNTVDRGPSLYSLLYLLFHHKAGRTVDKAFFRKLATFLLAPALSNSNRPIKEYRLKNFLVCAKKILSKPYQTPKKEL